jgi:TolB-like protein/Flp pilus assembly protein TadD
VSFYKELKRRNVFRASAAYLVLSWAITQVTGAVVPALHLPDSIPSIVVWLAFIGFPFVILFSWVYELTPEGLKRESEVDRAASITHITSRRLDYIIIGLMVLAIGLFVADRLFLVGAPEGVNGLARDTSAQSVAPDDRAQGALLQDTPAIAVDDKSIAVLPFVDMSADKDQEHMSDGMSEELLNLLSQVPDLKVIARTSSFAFKDQNIEIAEIAKKLNVAHVLEGSVRKSGNTVRITAQLVRAADSTHLWSETYDRPLDNIFKVQDEIANAIVQALQIRLAGGELSRRKGGTQNLEAYQLYLRAVSAVNQNTRESLDAAGGYLEQAIKLDPGYGMAWYSLAIVVSMKTDNVWLAPTEGWERVRQLAQHALQLSPDLAEAHARLQWAYMSLDWDWPAAEAEGQRALAIDPTNPGALMAAGRLSATLGRWDDSERQLRAALVRDPLNPYLIWNLGFSYYRAGRFAESEGLYRKLLELEPGFLWTRSYLGKTLLAQGKPDAALAMVQQEPDEATRLWFLPVVLQAAGRQAEADEALQAQIAQWVDTGAFFVAITYAYRGDHDRALEWLERAYQQKDASLDEIVGEPLFKSMADDPRFKAFLRKMNLPTEPVPLNWQ